MKIVVTGALGHIGSYLIRDLAMNFPKAEILMLDNMMTQRYASLFNMPAVGRYSFVEVDVTKANLAALIDGAHIVVHLAAITDAAGSFENPDLLEVNNYLATYKVAEACVTTNARLIALSSTSVYGTQKDVVTEDCAFEDLKPQSPYAVTKLKEERLISRLVLEDGLNAIICRFGTIFGASPGMRFHTAVNKFCWQAVMGVPISVWRTAYDQRRPYLDLSDAARAIAFIIREEIFDGKIYNVLSTNATVREVVDVIQEFYPELKIQYVDNKIMNQLSYQVSCAKFESKGFKFSGNLKKGIGETLNTLRQSNIATLNF